MSMEKIDQEIQKPVDILIAAKALAEQKQRLRDELIGLHQESIKGCKKEASITGSLVAAFITGGGLTLRSWARTSPSASTFAHMSRLGIGSFCIYSGLLVLQPFLTSLHAQSHHYDMVKCLENNDLKTMKDSVKCWAYGGSYDPYAKPSLFSVTVSDEQENRLRMSWRAIEQSDQL
jgi:hypothetical protein